MVRVMTRLLIASLILAFTLGCAPARAGAAEIQGGESLPPTLLLHRYKPTHPERILMAFEKTGALQPDFADWAAHSPYLDAAKATDRDAIISRETNRLSNAYATFDTTEPLVVHVKLTLNDYSTLQEILTLDEFTQQTFFSYAIYGREVAIVPKDIANFHTLKIRQAEMDEILKKAGGTGIVAELLLKPTYADTRAPFEKGGRSYWLLLGDIGELRLWSADENDPKLLWLYRADWFQPKEDRDLLDLKPTGSGLM